MQACLLAGMAFLGCGQSQSGTLDAGSVASLEDEGEPTHFSDERVWVVHSSNGGFIALSDVDPHPHFGQPDCAVVWRPDITLEGVTGWFRGTCSGSTWSREGELRSGPSPGALAQLPTRIEGDRLLIELGDR